MPRHNGHSGHVGGHHHGRSGGNMRRIRKKGKGTYRAKQERWRARAKRVIADHLGVTESIGVAVTSGARPAKPKNPRKPQKPKRPKGGSK